MCASAPFFGAKRGEIILEKLANLEKSKDKVFLDRLYSILNILDAKANGLLRVNSLFLTMLIFFIGWSHAPSGFPEYLQAMVPLAYIDTLLLVVSSVLCLLVVAVKWKFLGYVIAEDFSKEVQELAKVVDDRTHFFLLAWSGTMLTMFLSVVWVVWMRIF
jgi:hypothetical protein